MKVSVATCQFPVSADLRRNANYVERQMRIAAERGAHVAHFAEGSLSGYAGVDFASHDSMDWDLLHERTERIREVARELELWVLLGSSHRLSGKNKPHNSVYIIGQAGEIVDRYDKLFCAGNRSSTEGDLSHYSPGDHFTVFRLHGVRCGVLICHDYRYPELYREYKQKGVDLVFHSYHAGNVPAGRLAQMRAGIGEDLVALNSGDTLPEITMPASMHAAAASSHVWISCANTSARHSCFPAFFVRPDGVVTGRLRRHRAGVLISEVDTDADLYDSTVSWRGRAMRGIYHSGKLVDDPRSRNRSEL